MEWVGATKVQLVQMRVRCESIIWWRKRLSPFPSLSSGTLLFPFDPFLSPAPYSALNPFSPFPSTLLYSDLRFPEIAGYLFRFRNCVGCASAVELQSHRRILAPGLTKRLIIYQSKDNQPRNGRLKTFSINEFSNASAGFLYQLVSDSINCFTTLTQLPFAFAFFLWRYFNG